MRANLCLNQFNQASSPVASTAISSGATTSASSSSVIVTQKSREAFMDSLKKMGVSNSLTPKVADNFEEVFKLIKKRNEKSKSLEIETGEKKEPVEKPKTSPPKMGPLKFPPNRSACALGWTEQANRKTLEEYKADLAQWKASN
ncbi:MAG: hypothetical protein K940chlam1_00318 [Candidatus Anoxychlamydiales bacterium]|nr:hypothetical protein [Candidatus Anoxychlamydiales bacterium]NGX36511.1 hypothetical protein [Candidatus Anoxychlamydiales bacterium]